MVDDLDYEIQIKSYHSHVDLVYSLCQLKDYYNWSSASFEIRISSGLFEVTSEKIKVRVDEIYNKKNIILSIIEGVKEYCTKKKRNNV